MDLFSIALRVASSFEVLKNPAHYLFDVIGGRKDFRGLVNTYDGVEVIIPTVPQQQVVYATFGESRIFCFPDYTIMIDIGCLSVNFGFSTDEIGIFDLVNAFVCKPSVITSNLSPEVNMRKFIPIDVVARNGEILDQDGYEVGLRALCADVLKPFTDKFFNSPRILDEFIGSVVEYMNENSVVGLRKDTVLFGHLSESFFVDAATEFFNNKENVEDYAFPVLSKFISAINQAIDDILSRSPSYWSSPTE